MPHVKSIEPLSIRLLVCIVLDVLHTALHCTAMHCVVRAILYGCLYRYCPDDRINMHASFRFRTFSLCLLSFFVFLIDNNQIVQGNWTICNKKKKSKKKKEKKIVSDMHKNYKFCIRLQNATKFIIVYNTVM